MPIDRADLIEKKVWLFVEEIRGTAPQLTRYGDTTTEQWLAITEVQNTLIRCRQAGSNSGHLNKTHVAPLAKRGASRHPHLPVRHSEGIEMRLRNEGICRPSTSTLTLRLMVCGASFKCPRQHQWNSSCQNEPPCDPTISSITTSAPALPSASAHFAAFPKKNGS